MEKQRPDYYSIKKLSNSSLKYFLEYPPKKAFFLWNESVEETHALIFGRAAHCYLLEPEVFDEQFAVLSEDINLRTKAGKEERDNLLEKGLTVITHNDFVAIEEMRKSLFSNEKIAQLLKDIKAETEYFDKIEGLDLKAKLDAEKKNVVLDYKTCQDASEERFMKECIKRHYFMQGYLYTQISKKEHFVFIAQEKKPPYSCGIYAMTADQFEIGRQLFLEAVASYKYAEKNKLEDYASEIVRMETPDWYMNKWIEKNKEGDND